MARALSGWALVAVGGLVTLSAGGAVLAGTLGGTQPPAGPTLGPAVVASPTGVPGPGTSGAPVTLPSREPGDFDDTHDGGHRTTRGKADANAPETQEVGPAPVTEEPEDDESAESRSSSHG